MAGPNAQSRRDAALELADGLLGDIELSRIPPSDIARKTSRLARLLDDTEAMAWLQAEIGGFEQGEEANTLTPAAFAAARRSNRVSRDRDGSEKANTMSLGQLQKTIDGAIAQIGAAADRPVSIQSANPQQMVFAPPGNKTERGAVRNYAGELQATLDKVIGAIHDYVASKYQELRFGASVENAFQVVRSEVDARIAELVPDALPKLSAAFENATSDNPEDWASAAATCRRLLKASADALRPPGPAVSGRDMGDANYINRLVDWIINQADSTTRAAMIKADLEYLGQRLDAANEAGHKGAHAEVDRVDASRFVAGTYLLLGDLLRLRAVDPAEPSDSVPAG